LFFSHRYDLKSISDFAYENDFQSRRYEEDPEGYTFRIEDYSIVLIDLNIPMNCPGNVSAVFGLD
jgi:hypothetical protein